jgi:hypothetical protein
LGIYSHCFATLLITVPGPVSGKKKGFLQKTAFSTYPLKNAVRKMDPVGINNYMMHLFETIFLKK